MLLTLVITHATTPLCFSDFANPCLGMALCLGDVNQSTVIEVLGALLLCDRDAES